MVTSKICTLKIGMSLYRLAAIIKRAWENLYKSVTVVFESSTQSPSVALTFSDQS